MYSKKQGDFKLRYKKNRFQQIKEYLQNEALNQQFVEAGLKFTSFQYQLSRYLALIFLFVLIILYQTAKQDVNIVQFGMLIALALTTSPKEKVLNRRTPFKIMIDFLTDSHRKKLNRELFHVLSHLKNIAIIKQHQPVGAIYILDRMRNFTKHTRPIFNRMIAYWNMGEYEQAVQFFINQIQTKEAEKLASIFRKLDYLNPVELKNQIIILQEEIIEKRKTEKKKRYQAKSYAIYFLSTLGVIVVFLNFMAVALFIDLMKEMNR